MSSVVMKQLGLKLLSEPLQGQLLSCCELVSQMNKRLTVQPPKVTYQSDLQEHVQRIEASSAMQAAQLLAEQGQLAR